MASVQVRINGREYSIACDDGQENHLKFLSEEVNNRIKALVQSMGTNPGEATALLLNSLMMADEIAENKKEIKQLANEVRQLSDQLQHDSGQQEHMDRIAEIENAMAITMEEIAMRIERIAHQVEVS